MMENSTLLQSFFAKYPSHCHSRLQSADIHHVDRVTDAVTDAVTDKRLSQFSSYLNADETQAFRQAERTLLIQTSYSMHIIYWTIRCVPLAGTTCFMLWNTLFHIVEQAVSPSWNNLFYLIGTSCSTCGTGCFFKWNALFLHTNA